jgi:hypothetical protein
MLSTSALVVSAQNRCSFPKYLSIPRRRLFDTDLQGGFSARNLDAPGT